MALLQSEDDQLSGIAPFVAIDRHIEQSRSIYYSTLHQCSEGRFFPYPTNYSLEPLAWFFIKVVEESLKDIAYYRERYKLEV